MSRSMFVTHSLKQGEEQTLRNMLNEESPEARDALSRYSLISLLCRLFETLLYVDYASGCYTPEIKRKKKLIFSCLLPVADRNSKLERRKGRRSRNKNGIRRRQATNNHH